MLLRSRSRARKNDGVEPTGGLQTGTRIGLTPFSRPSLPPDLHDFRRVWRARPNQSRQSASSAPIWRAGLLSASARKIKGASELRPGPVLWPDACQLETCAPKLKLLTLTAAPAAFVAALPLPSEFNRLARDSLLFRGHSPAHRNQEMELRLESASRLAVRSIVDVRFRSWRDKKPGRENNPGSDQFWIAHAGIREGHQENPVPLIDFDRLCLPMNARNSVLFLARWSSSYSRKSLLDSRVPLQEAGSATWDQASRSKASNMPALEKTRPVDGPAFCRVGLRRRGLALKDDDPNTVFPCRVAARQITEIKREGSNFAQPPPRRLGNASGIVSFFGNRRMNLGRAGRVVRVQVHNPGQECARRVWVGLFAAQKRG
ncbi:hypothetical protein L1887_55970 [Cichorium endivia]|nr:hypothetical protein L1887_55970 [Cichorium endivia]